MASANSRYERSMSPPRSSNSSGYGTGNSSKSFTRETKFAATVEGTMTSSSSGQSGDERWYEVIEASENGDSPPPLPIRLGTSGSSAFIHLVKSNGRQQEPTYISSSSTYSTVGPLQPFSTPYVEFDGEKQQDGRGAKSRSERAMEYLTRAPKVLPCKYCYLYCTVKYILNKMSGLLVSVFFNIFLPFVSVVRFYSPKRAHAEKHQPPP